MPADWSRLAELLRAYRRDGLLTEPEGLDLLDALGVAVLAHQERAVLVGERGAVIGGEREIDEGDVEPEEPHHRPRPHQPEREPRRERDRDDERHQRQEAFGAQ